jgi:hypothetical protein
MKEKQHVALDENFLDLTNIASKLQRHLVLESEILSNHERIVQVPILPKVTNKGLQRFAITQSF